MEHYLFEKITLESLVRFMEGTAAGAEKQLVEDWINSDIQHREFFQRIKEAWLSPGDIESLRKENIERDWNQILLQIQEKENISELPLSNKPSLNTLRRLWRMAAVLLITVSLLGAYFIGKSRYPQSQLPAITYNEIVVPKGQRSQLILSDGSKIWINAGSKFRFPNQFGGKIREVWLEGEAFFEVARDKSKPFHVHTSDLNLRVYGTSFNVRAYADEDIIETTLIEGLVSFKTKGISGKPSKEIYLKPNHKAIYLKKETTHVTEEIKREITGPLEPHKIIISKPVEVEPVISWTEGKLVFADETFDNIAVKLERKYNVKIYIVNDDIKNIKYTGVLRNVSIEQAMKAIQLSMPINYTIRENSITISKN